MRIVIVEDEIKIREGMRKLIEDETHHDIVGEGENGKEGLELILRFKPDLVITDIRMPIMNGLEMIKEIYKLDIHIHTVILSGYAEFEYAKAAIQYNVYDYLLKPLAAEDVQGALASIEESIEIENEKAQGTRESFIRDILFGYIEDDEKAYKKLAHVCGFQDRMKYLLIMGYIGSAPATYKKEIEKIMMEIKKKYKKCFLFTFFQESKQRFYCLAAGVMDMDEFKIYFHKRLIYPYIDSQEQPVWTAEEFTTYYDLKQAGDGLNTYLSYAISIGSHMWLDHNTVREFKPESYTYPSEIINSLKGGICSNDKVRIMKASHDFLEYFHNRSFDAYNIRQAFLKTYYMISDLLSDIDKSLFEQLKNTNILRLIEEAVTWVELKNAYMDIMHMLTSQKNKRDDIGNYTIKRAINCIREHYQECITLDDVARKLEITPEYLSTLFNRVMGINFSTFLKQFRISHAKRLLKGTNLKIYEISQKVGYSDPKYFMRVFKDEIGISPGEYRQQ